MVHVVSVGNLQLSCRAIHTLFFALGSAYRPLNSDKPSLQIAKRVLTNEACVTTTASTPTPPPTTNTISTNIADGATLSGSSVIWTAVPSGVPVRVEFFIDGTLGATELQSPYQFNGDPEGVLNTKTLANGSIS